MICLPPLPPLSSVRVAAGALLLLPLPLPLLRRRCFGAVVVWCGHVMAEKDVHFSYPTRPHARVLGGMTLEVSRVILFAAAAAAAAAVGCSSCRCCRMDGLCENTSRGKASTEKACTHGSAFEEAHPSAGPIRQGSTQAWASLLSVFGRY